MKSPLPQPTLVEFYDMVKRVHALEVSLEKQYEWNVQAFRRLEALEKALAEQGNKG